MGRRGSITLLCVAHAVNMYSISSIFSYVGFLAVDCNWAKDVDQAGAVSGFLAASVPLGRVLTSYLWGIISDRIGNYNALFISMLNMAAGNFVFGFATNLSTAILSRAGLLGAANGWLTIMGPMILEVGGEKEQAHVFGVVIGAGTAMSIFAPSVGALLYKVVPAFPALGPSVLGGLISVMVAAIAFSWGTLAKDATPAIDTTLPVPEAATVAARVGAEHNVDLPKVKARCESFKTAAMPHSALRLVLLAHPFTLITSLRALNGFFLFAAMDILPLWLIGTRPAGGLALNEKQVASVLAVSGILLSLYSGFVHGRTVSWLGTQMTFLMGGVVAAISGTVMPYAASVYVAIPIQSIFYCGFIAQFGAIISMTNNKVGKYQKMTGAINGVIVTVEAIAKGFGPALGAPVIAIALESRRVPLAFALFGICIFLTSLLVLLLTDDRKQHKQDLLL